MQDVKLKLSLLERVQMHKKIWKIKEFVQDTQGTFEISPRKKNTKQKYMHMLSNLNVLCI